MRRDDLVAMVKGIAPVVRHTIAVALETLSTRVAVLENRDPVPGPAGANGQDGRHGTDGAPGLAGERGVDGRDGRDGKDGRDGVDGKSGDRGVAGRDGIDAFDLDVTHDGERTFTFTWSRLDPIEGSRTETRSFVVPCVLYRGVWQEAQPYTKGDAVTWSGSQWIARADTTGARPGLAVEASRVWVLASKAGRDGKPGKDGTNGAPGRDGKDYGR